LSRAKSFVKNDYVATDEDILRLRKKTTSISETLFCYKGKNFRLVDVGGQKNERKKWIYCFDNVHAIIFVVSTSEYDIIFEDTKVNRLHESLMLFEETINLKVFAKTPIILFLNKTDLFEKKINTLDLKHCFPEYNGGCDAKKAKEYIRQKFTDANKNCGDRGLYTHFTTATDTENIRVVFNAISDIMLRQVLDAAF